MTLKTYLKNRGITLTRHQRIAAGALLGAMVPMRSAGNGKTFLLRLLSDFIELHGNEFIAAKKEGGVPLVQILLKEEIDTLEEKNRTLLEKMSMSTSTCNYLYGRVEELKKALPFWKRGLKYGTASKATDQFVEIGLLKTEVKALKKDLELSREAALEAEEALAEMEVDAHDGGMM